MKRKNEVDVNFAEVTKTYEKPAKRKKKNKKNPKIFNLSAISIIACDCLQAVICIFIDLFFISKVLKGGAGSEGISTNILKSGLFYAIYYLVLTISYAFSGFALKKIKKSIFVSIGAVVLSMVVLTVFLLGDQVTSFTFIPVVALMYGVGFSFFSSGFNNLMGETISSKHQVRFFAVKKIMFQATYIIFPISLGFLADIDFSIATYVMFGVAALLIFFSFLIKPKKSFNLSFNLPKWGKYLRENKKATKPLWLMYVTNFFRGASYDCFTTLITILVISNVGSNSTLGTYQSIFTACSLLTMLVYLKVYRKKRAKHFIIPIVTLVSCTIVGILAATNTITIILFYAVYTVLNVVLMSVSDSRRSGVIRVLSLHSHILESNAFGDFSLGLGRIFSSVLLILAGLFDALVGGGSIFLKITIAIVCALYVMYGVSLIWLEKALIKQDEEFRMAHISEVIEKTED